MKIISIGSDRKLFEKNSQVRARILEYGKVLGEMHIIVFSKKSSGLKEEKISEDVSIYPTNSLSKLFYICDAIKIAKKIKDADVVTAQDPFESGIAGYLIAKKKNIKLQLQIHTDLFSPYFKKGSILNKIRVQIAKYLLPKADYIRVVSERIKDSLKSLKLKCEPFVLPVFVDTEKFKNAQIKTDLKVKYPQFEKIVLMASRLTKEKNIPLAIDAMELVIKKYPTAGLVIVGEGPEKENIKKYSQKLKANIDFEDWTDDLASYYKSSDIFLLTSDYEGCVRTIIEASSAGSIVVSTNVGCSEGAIMVERNANDIAEKIGELIKNPKNPDFKPKYSSKEEYLKTLTSQY